jgi:hypothetical protein
MASGYSCANDFNIDFARILPARVNLRPASPRSSGPRSRRGAKRRSFRHPAALPPVAVHPPLAATPPKRDQQIRTRPLNSDLTTTSPRWRTNAFCANASTPSRFTPQVGTPHLIDVPNANRIRAPSKRPRGHVKHAGHADEDDGMPHRVGADSGSF